jgi:hypothetical protein
MQLAPPKNLYICAIFCSSVLSPDTYYTALLVPFPFLLSLRALLSDLIFAQTASIKAVVGKAVQLHVLEHAHGREQDTRGVDHVLASYVQSCVARALLEHGTRAPYVGAGRQPRAAHEPSDRVGDLREGAQRVSERARSHLEGLARLRPHQGAVKIWRDHDIELLRLGHELHHAVVDDDLLVLDRGEELCHLRARF